MIRLCMIVPILGLITQPASGATADDTETKCADLLKSLNIKSGTDYDTVSARLRAKGWHQTQTTTLNIGSWTKSGRSISVTLNLGNGASTTTAGAVRCRN